VARNTIRKQLLEEAFECKFCGQIVLLDELRWEIFRQEMLAKRRRAVQMDRRYSSSFNRTISRLPSLEKLSLGHPFWLEPGLLARIACFRLERWSAISAFLADPNALCTVTQYRTSPGLRFRGEATWQKGFRPVGLQVCELTWRSKSGHQRHARIILPQSHKILCFRSKSDRQAKMPSGLKALVVDDVLSHL
jgi:hypothetical protein